MPRPAPAFGLIDLLAAAVATVFVVATMLPLTPWTLRLAGLAGGAAGVVGGWLATRRSSWEYKVMGVPGFALVGMLVAAGLWHVGPWLLAR
jgi:hypothetical protein